MDDTLHIYTRVSTKEQSEQNTSLDTQRTLGERCAKELGVNPIIWNEGAQSSSKDDLDNRPILVNLLNEIDEGKVSKLYVWNTDRLSRNQKTWGLIRYKLNQNGVLLFSGSDFKPIDLSNPMDDLLVGLLSEISQYDNKLRTERFRLGKLKRVRDGGWLGGPPPFGYRIENKRLAIEEFESKWVRKIFQMYLDGSSVDQIRNELMKSGISTRRGNKVWSHGSINALLGNTHYGGYYKMTDKKSGETITVECDPILSKSLFDDVRKEKKKRSYSKGRGRTNGGNQKKEYLLKGLLVCGGCGKFYGARSFKDQHLNHYYCVNGERSWVTKGTNKQKKCVRSKRNLKIGVTDELVWDTVIQTMSNSVLFKQGVKDEILSANSTQTANSDIAAEQRKLRKVNKELKDVENAIVELETDRLLKKRSDREVTRILSNIENHYFELEKRRESIEGVINNTKQSLHWVDWVNEFSDKIEELKSETDMQVKKRFLEGLLENILVTSDDKQTHSITLNFKIPYVNDKLVWKDQTKKSDGYDLTGGDDNITLVFDGKNYPLKKEKVS